MLGFQIGQQADLFEGLQRHGLGFLDKHHHFTLIAVLGQQVILQGFHDLEAIAVAGDVQTDFKGDGMKDVVGREAGVGEVDNFDVFRQARFQHSA